MQMLSALLPLFVPLLVPILVMCVIFILVYVLQRNAYLKTEYYAATRKKYSAIRRDVGSYGEYLIYKQLTKLEGNKRFLFNCYVPKSGGGTTEIDVILLHVSGIYVFESKNYSGWIFGSESKKMWTQTFPNGHKERFYNPIMQNNTHTKELKRNLANYNDESFRSIVVFSNRCELKSIDLTTNHHRVVKRNHLLQAMTEFTNHQLLSDEEIENIYLKLFPFTQVSEEVRTAHIDEVSSKR